MKKHLFALMCAMATTGAMTQDASAFCGFYVSGADAKMFNNATQVVMMRQGETTVLSMQNNYKGPTEDFAMVVPVPVVLEEERVKVLSDEIFKRVDQMASPRLVEYWERDPCFVPEPRRKYKKRRRTKSMVVESAPPMSEPEDLGVTIEAEFDVGEYNVVILSAKESNGLETWLELNEYNIPDGAAGVLKGYIEAGQYFFVAKVDVEKVPFEDGQATLSPLRFHYDSKDFSLPVRLGLLNADGAQDLIIHILAQDQRYEVANRPNVTIPTNLFVDKSVKEDFAGFYVTLFDNVMGDNPGAVVTEYSWLASSCDPCPGPTLGYSDFYTLGADVFDGELQKGGYMPRGARMNWVLTRLHARYTADELEEDLVFKKADALIGGRGTPTGLPATIAEQGATTKDAYMNNFQGRYIMLNPWEGELACEHPRRGIWGGPPVGKSGSGTVTARKTAFAKRGGFDLASVIQSPNAPGLNLGGAPAAKTDEGKGGEDAAKDAAKEAADAASKVAKESSTKQEKKSQCAHVAPGDSGAPSGLLVLVFGGFMVSWRRRRTS